jgi:hypothetical protein
MIRWSFVLANRPTSQANKYRPSPPLRVVYPGGLIMFGWGVLFYVSVMLDPKETMSGGDFVVLVVCAVFLGTTLCSWPVVIEVSERGLTWHRLLRRRFVGWTEIKDVSVDMDGGLVIYGRGGLRIEVSQYTEGRAELKQYIKSHKLSNLLTPG